MLTLVELEAHLRNAIELLDKGAQKDLEQNAQTVKDILHSILHQLEFDKRWQGVDVFLVPNDH